MVKDNLSFVKIGCSFVLEIDNDSGKTTYLEIQETSTNKSHTQPFTQLTRLCRWIPSYWPVPHLWSKHRTATAADRGFPPARLPCGFPLACQRGNWSSVGRICRTIKRTQASKQTNTTELVTNNPATPWLQLVVPHRTAPIAGSWGF